MPSATHYAIAAPCGVYVALARHKLARLNRASAVDSRVATPKAKANVLL